MSLNKVLSNKTDYLSKTCEECKKYSPKGLRFDLDAPIKDRKWLCDKCYFKHV